MSDGSEALERLIRRMIRFQYITAGLTLLFAILSNTIIAMVFYVMSSDRMNVAIEAIERKIDESMKKPDVPDNHNQTVNVSPQRGFDDALVEWMKWKYDQQSK